MLRMGMEKFAGRDYQISLNVIKKRAKGSLGHHRDHGSTSISEILLASSS
jgi:hypothetical protein